MISCKSDRAVTIWLDIAGPPVLKLPSPHRPSSGELKDLRSNGATAFFFKDCIILCMCIGVSPACMPLRHMRTWCPQRASDSRQLKL